MEFYNLKNWRIIIFALERRKKNEVAIVENVPIRMRVIFNSKRIEFTTGYRIDVAKWDAAKQRGKTVARTNSVKMQLIITPSCSASTL